MRYLMAPVCPGEVLDKLTILQIKCVRFGEASEARTHQPQTAVSAIAVPDASNSAYIASGATAPGSPPASRRARTASACVSALANRP